MAIQGAPHIPVLLNPILKQVSPVRGVWLDGTFGAGGYTRALLDAGAQKVIAIDRDPEVFDRASAWAKDYGDALVLAPGKFGDLDEIAAAHDCPVLDGVVLDIGVSSMQLDQAGRGFSFAKDGPLDMRMGQDGVSAADIVNTAAEGQLADILYQFGEERASRRLARAIVNKRKEAPFERTLELTAMIEGVMPRPKPGQVHPATRSFQALRIAVNDELGELARGLEAAERALKDGGCLAVVSFHSLEDRIVKRFMQLRSGMAPNASRYAPETATEEAAFKVLTRKAIGPDEDEMTNNPRARSAKLRVARRLSAPPAKIDYHRLGVPDLSLTGVLT